MVNEVTGIRLAATCDLVLAGYRGRPVEAMPLFAATTEDALARGEGFAVADGRLGHRGPPQRLRAATRRRCRGAAGSRGDFHPVAPSWRCPN